MMMNTSIFFKFLYLLVISINNYILFQKIQIRQSMVIARYHYLSDKTAKIKKVLHTKCW